MYYVITKGRKSKIVKKWSEAIMIMKKNNGANYQDFNSFEDAKEYYDSYNRITNGGIEYEFKEIVLNRIEKNRFKTYNYKGLNKEGSELPKMIFIDHKKDETLEEGKRRVLREIKKKELEKEQEELIKRNNEINERLNKLDSELDNQTKNDLEEEEQEIEIK